MTPTAEEIFSKHLESMVKRTDQSYCSVDEMKTQPEWGASIQAMVEFAKLHVEAALKAASNVAFPDSKWDVEQSYPLENIK